MQERVCCLVVAPSSVHGSCHLFGNDARLYDSLLLLAPDLLNAIFETENSYSIGYRTPTFVHLPPQESEVLGKSSI